MDAHAFAADWEAGWNSHDLDRILAHYREDMVFRSRKALALMGDGTLRGKPALRAYWRAALDRQPDLAFRVIDVLEGHGMLAITYRNHRDVLACEVFSFDPDGLVREAAALHRDP